MNLGNRNTNHEAMDSKNSITPDNAKTSGNYVVVGGSQGIGAAIVERLVAAGNSVIVYSRTPGRLTELPTVAHRIWDAARDDFPSDELPESLAGLVYCPGSIQLRSFANLKLDQFREDLEVNLFGAIKSLQACLPNLKRGATIHPSRVVLFSTVAVQTGMAMHASIAVAKGAIEGLTRTLAAEWSPTVRVNAIAPALTETGLTQRFFGTPEKRQAMDARYPMKRVGRPVDIASAAMYLLNAEDSWITGQILHVDGGMSSVYQA